jgi:hyperosmotically inducible periplasmic protein
MTALADLSRSLYRTATPLLTAAITACSVAAEPIVFSELDIRHEAQIQTTYALSPLLSGHLLDVRVRDGHVTLSGVVEDVASSTLAVAIARAVDGISQVESLIEVDAAVLPQPPVFGQRSYGAVVNDATMVATITSKFLWSRHASGLRADVTVQDGTVTLSGTADTEAARIHAQQLAQGTRGVGIVRNRMTVEPGARAPSAVSVWAVIIAPKQRT